LIHPTFRFRLALIALLMLAFALRVYRLDAQSLWYDEAVTAHVVGQGIPELTRWTADDIQPPLYYYLVAVWTGAAGRGEWALRTPSACFGVLTVALLWALARRLFRSDTAGLVAALLTALSPLYVYFAQEARMYAQLTFLGSFAGYALLRATADRAPRTTGRDECTAGRSLPPVFGASTLRWWLGFVFSSVAALYTHYFAIFMLLAYSVCMLAASTSSLVRGKPRRSAMSRLAAFGGALCASAVLYLPWLPAMITRYRVDRSYWQGTLKLGEALRHVAVSFTTGAPETMLETAAVRLLPWFGLGLCIAVFATAGRAVRERRQRAAIGLWGLAAMPGFQALIYLLTCLLIPTLAILALASRTPKFNARYLMLVSPAYLLILAGGISALLALGRGANVDRGAAGPGSAPAPAHPRLAGDAARLMQHAASLAAVMLTVFLCTTAAAALRNWFTDRAFAKSQWRELAAAVRARIAPGEAVILTSGHAWPAWDYYAPDIPRLRLPEIDILDVNAVLGFDTGPLLGRALAGKTGAWLVRWQAEAVDPLGFAPYFLDRAGTELPIAQRFWHLELRHWSLRPDAHYPGGPEPSHVTAANYAHKVALLGWDDPVNRQLTVYWRTLNLMDRDYRVSLILQDAAGQEVGRWDGRPAGYNYPTTRWQAGQALLGRYPLPFAATAVPSGDYYVTLAVYDDDDPSGLDIKDVADNPAGKRVRLGPFNVRP
jgi:mannosyltransferase